MEATISLVKMKTRSVIERKIEESSVSQHVLYIIWKSIVTSNLRPVERCLSLFSIVAGVWMGWPFANQLQSSVAAYAVLVQHLPPVVWTVFFITFSIPSLIGCDLDRTVFPNFCVSRRLRVWAAIASLWVWTFISLVLIFDRNPSLATIWAPVIAIHQLWILLWLWTNEQLPTNKKGR